MYHFERGKSKIVLPLRFSLFEYKTIFSDLAVDIPEKKFKL